MQTEIELQATASISPAAEALDGLDERRASFSVWALVGGLAIGWLGSIFFLNKTIGLSFPLFIGLLIGGALIATRQVRTRLTLRNLWLGGFSLLFAALVAFHADPSLTFMNAALALGLGALWLHYLLLPQRIDETSLAEYSLAAVESVAMTTTAPLAEFGHARDWLRTRSGEQMRTLLAVGRGLLLALPVLLIFAVLLSSADAAFSGVLDQIWRALGIGRIDHLITQGILIMLLGWLGVGVIAYAAYRRVRAAPPPIEGAKPRAKRQPILLSMIESSIVLGSVNLLFVLFVLIQFGYFFGGQDNITVNGLTYAVYARRGFFELVAVAVLTLALVLALDWVTVRSGARQHTIFRALALLMVACTGVIMISASLRMSLYEAAYGYTHLRLHTHNFIRWLAVLFGFFVLTLFRLRPNIFSLGVLVCVIGYAASLNAINVEGYIAERNIERYFEGQALDGYYLYTFSVDAVQPMLALYHREDAPEPVRDFAGSWLMNQRTGLAWLREGPGGTIFSAHVARDQAWLALEPLKFEFNERTESGACCYFILGSEPTTTPPQTDASSR